MVQLPTKAIRRPDIVVVLKNESRTYVYPPIRQRSRLPQVADCECAVSWIVCWIVS